MGSNESSSSAAGPLKGLKVADFTSVIAGSAAAVLLGDFGAEVIKIESLEGDLSRWFGPFLKGEGGMFNGWNRNKRGIAIDLRTDEGLQVAHAIIRDSDILLENFRPGIVDKLKIDYETVRGINPQIIYCSITGFGSKGPESRRPAFDPLLQSMSGSARLNAQFAQIERSACISAVPTSDYAAAFLGAGGIMAALYHRERTGEGQRLETSLMQGAMAVLSNLYFQALEIEPDEPPGIYPYIFYETKDDLIFVAAATDKFWRLMCDAIGASELGADKRYATNPLRSAGRLELHPKVQPFFLKKTTAEWEAILVAKDVPCAAPLTYQEFFDHPQVEAMGMCVNLDHPKLGPVRMSGVPVNFEKTPGRIQRTAPCLGEHNDEVLKEIGYNEVEIEILRAKGIIP